MCFVPQQRALFRHLNPQFLTLLTWKCVSCHNGRHLNVKEWSENGVLCTFWLGTVLRATTTYDMHFFHVSTSKSTPRMVCFVHFDLEMCFAPQQRTACNFSSLIWPDGSAPAALASLLFDPPEPQIIGKNIVKRGFPTFSRTCMFFLLSLSLLWSSHFFSSLTLPTSAFPSVHVVGSLTSKLPSIMEIP